MLDDELGLVFVRDGAPLGAHLWALFDAEPVSDVERFVIPELQQGRVGVVVQAEEFPDVGEVVEVIWEADYIEAVQPVSGGPAGALGQLVVA